MTEKEFKLKHQKELDDEFLLRYPNGRFCYQIFDGHKYLSWESKRPTSWTRQMGISLGIHVDETLSFRAYKSSSFGKNNYYNSLDKFINKLKKENISERNINIFINIYKNFEKEKLNIINTKGYAGNKTEWLNKFIINNNL